jgi:hypothetical protein
MKPDFVVPAFFGLPRPSVVGLSLPRTVTAAGRCPLGCSTRTLRGVAAWQVFGADGRPLGELGRAEVRLGEVSAILSERASAIFSDIPIGEFNTRELPPWQRR